MKTLLALIIATAGLAAAAPEASAGGCRVSFRYSPPSHCHVYKLYTRESCRHYFTKTFHNSCGRCYSVRYVRITYIDYYSNGSTRNYTRTFRA